MGKVTIGNETVTLDDRTLAHLEAAIVMKLRRRESFVVTWKRGLDEGGGRVSTWVHPGSNIDIRYDGRQGKRLNNAWLDALMRTANSVQGLTIVPEPAADEVVA